MRPDKTGWSWIWQRDSLVDAFMIDRFKAEHAEDPASCRRSSIPEGVACVEHRSSC